MISLESTRQARQITRLVTVGIVLMLGAMWVSIGYFAMESRSARIAEEQRVLARISRVVEEQTHSLFSLIDYFLVSADLWLQNRPDTDPRSDPEFLELVRVFRAKTNGLVDVRFVSASGGLYYTGKTGSEPLAQVGDRDYYQAQMQPGTRGLFIAKPVLSRVTGLWGLPVSYPLKAKPHDIAVIFAAIENRVMTQPFEAVRTQPDGSILVAHRDGTVIFRSPDGMTIGKSLAASWLWTNKLPVEPEGTYQVDTGALDGKARIVSYSSVPDYPLVVFTTSATNDVLTDWRIKTAALSAFGVLSTLLGLVVLWRLRLSVRELDTMKQKFEEQANMDYLTQIPNRRSFVEKSKNEIARAQRYDHSLSLLMFDIDHFKIVNDSHGHEFGDQVLKAIAVAVQEGLRSTDFQGRLGGEEFAVLLIETSGTEALEVAERLRQCIERLVLLSASGQGVSITISVGMAALTKKNEDLDQLLALADRALYRAKSAGRNCVCTNLPE